VPALRRINSLLLPVPYPDSFYAKALDPLASGLFSRAILWQDSEADTPKVIGGLICRLEPNPFLDTQGQLLPDPFPPSHTQKKPSNVPPNTPYHAIYIQSLALLSPYRSLGLAAAALEHIVGSATLLPVAGSSIDARTIYAHVWTENEEGLKWYEARGFAREGAEPVKGYYFKLRPDTAWVVRRHIGPTAAAAVAANLTTTTTTTTTSNAPHSSSDSVLAAAINLPTLAPKPPPAAAAPPPPPSPHAPTPGTSGGPPRRGPPSANASSTSLSFQNARPESEWNDLPADMVSVGKAGAGGNNNSSQLLSPEIAAIYGNSGRAGTGTGTGTPASGASSRSSSTGRKKRDRAYPTAAFGA
jgi:ribosomal protein S18 acetylase RimI-like enzyme